MFGIATDLQDPLASEGKGSGEVGGDCGFTDAPFAIEGNPPSSI